MLSNNKEIKIVDFGLAKQLSDFKEEIGTCCGTPNYIAPEILIVQRTGPFGDIWAMGCIMYAMLVGHPPFEAANVYETLELVKKADAQIPTFVSITAADLISKMLKPNPNHRITVDEILSHPFLQP